MAKISSQSDELLEGNDNINARDDHGQTLLYKAAASGTEARVTELLKSGAHVNSRARKRFTPLHIAAKNNHTGVIKLLIASNADKDRGNLRRMTPLMIACKFNQLQAIQTLISCGCDVTCRDMFERTAAHWAVKGCDLSALQLILDSGADINASDRFRKTLLLQSVKSNKTDILKYLLNQEMNMTAEDRYRRGVLHMAAAKERYRCINTLINFGINPDVMNSQGKTPLIVAAASGNYGSTKTLISKGANPNITDPNGLNGLLFLAFESKSSFMSQNPVFDIMLALLEANTDLDHMVNRGISWRPEEAHPHNALEVVTKLGTFSLVQLFARAGSSLGNLRKYFGMKTKELPEYFRKNQQCLDWVKSFYKHPQPLKVLCRKKIRFLIGVDFSRKTQSLSIAPGLKAYINFSDMRDLREQYGQHRSDGDAMPHEPEDGDSEEEYEASVFDSDNYDRRNIVDTDDETG